LGHEVESDSKRNPLYARAGIVEYWVLDINSRRVIVHREPQPNGTFGSVLSYAEQEDIRPLAAPEAVFRLSDLFKEEA
jgi:Uma2 family endonuclease